VGGLELRQRAPAVRFGAALLLGVPLAGKVDTSSKYLVWMGALALGVLSAWPGLVIGSVELAGERRIITTGGFTCWPPSSSAPWGRAFLLLWRTYVRSRGEARNQMRYVLAAWPLTALCGLATNLPRCLGR
jgi:hypothetical protein